MNRDCQSSFNSINLIPGSVYPSESIVEYVAALKKLAEFCYYGESLDKMLHNRFICGITHPTVQKHLLTETELTFTKTVTVAQAVELAEKGAQQIQLLDDKESKVVHKFSMTSAKQGANRNKDSASKEKPTNGSYRCGGETQPTHLLIQVRHLSLCNKRGHIIKVCNSNKLTVHYLKTRCS